MKTYVGVDPGKTGCVAIVAPLPLDSGNTIIFCDAEAGISLADIGTMIGIDAFVLLEKPQVMPGSKQRRLAAGEAAGQPGEQKEIGQGRIGILNYGIGYGEYLGMLKVLRIPFGEVHPMTWKKEFLLIGKPKEISIARAKQLFPSVADRLARKKDHGRAEALLIAEYARRKNM
jgi:crossover junction endodeoxyribonuclease RuvC